MQGMLGSGPQSMVWKDAGFLMGCPPPRGVGTGGRARDGKGSLMETRRTPRHTDGPGGSTQAACVAVSLLGPVV